MENKSKIKKNQIFHKPTPALLVATFLLVVAVIVGLCFVTQPQRNAANFCKVAKEQKPVLIGDVSYEKRLDAYKKLEAVSPDIIRPDVTTIRKGYEEIVKNPSDALNVGFGMSGAENRRTDYITANCKDF